MDSSSKGFRRLLFLFSFLLISIEFSPTVAPQYDCSDTGNFTANSAYDKNRNLILSSLVSHINIYNGGFYNTSIGQEPDKVYAFALCRADSTSEECAACVNSTSQGIMIKCPNQKEAFMWGDYDPSCIVRYADRDFFGILQVEPAKVSYGQGNITSNLTEFDQIWEGLMDGLVKRASMGVSRFKFATDQANLTVFQKIHALMQCTPDLSQKDCETCLRGYVSKYVSCCHGTRGGTVRGPNCISRWEFYRFYSDIASAPPPATSQSSGKVDNTTRTVIIIVVPSAVVIILIISIYIIFRLRKSKTKSKGLGEMRNTECPQFDIGRIRCATDNFSDANKLGQGGFGAVYKGTLPNGQQVAIKRLSMNSMQGEQEFKNEVTLVAKLQHRNLVKLLGFCFEQNEKILVYEFLANSSLDRFIFDPIKLEHLDWEIRYKIIEGIARGLLYLHEDSRLRIIHRDLKASNILLDPEMNPKISDFGMARLFEKDQTHINTNRVVGTFGYMAPEYVIHHRFSVKSDVFSFGVLLLEIVCGQKRSFFGTDGEIKCLLTNAWKGWNEETILNLIDSTLREGSRNEMMKCLHIGLLCVQESVSERPSMAMVVQMLNSDFVTLPAPSKPGFFMPNLVIHEASSSETNFRSKESDKLKLEAVPLSRNEATITELYPR